MQQAVLGRREFHEGAKILDADNFALERLAHLRFLDDAQDHGLSSLARRAFDGSDMDGAVFLDVDLSAGFILDTTNNLATGADDVADLVDGDMDGLDARSGVAQLLARLGEFAEHGGKDISTSLMRLSESTTEDFGRQAAGLVVHLQSSDALFGAAHLEVHVTEEVLKTLDVGQDDDVVAFLDKAHGNAGNGSLDRHARIHQRKGGSTGGSHGRRAVRLKHLGNHADGVGELLLGGDHRQKRALGKGAVAHLATLRGAHASNLAGAVRREVVLMHVALALGRIDGVETLPLVEHAERADGKRLRLTALEQAGAMDARQIAGNDVQRADLVGTTTVGALAGGDDHGAHGLLLELLERSGDIGAPSGKLLFAELFRLDTGLQVLDLAHAREFVGILERCGHLVEERVDTLSDARVGNMDRPLDRRDVATIEEALLSLAERGDSLLAEVHGTKHQLLGNLIGAGLDHGDVVGGAGDGQLEVGVFLLNIGGVDDELVGFGVVRDANASGRAVERRATEHKGGRSATDADAVGRILAIAHQRGGHNVDLALEAVGKAGANRSIDHARGERALFGGTGLTLEVAAGNAPDGVHLLDEVDGQREEVVVLLLFRDDGRDEHRGLAAGDKHRTRGLLGKLTGFEAILFAVQLERLDDLFHIIHSFSYLGAVVRPSFFGHMGYSRFPPPTERRASCAPDRYAKARIKRAFVALDVVADAELLDEGTVTLDVAFLDVGEQTATLTDEHHQTTAGMVILLVDLQVLGEVADALGEDGDLNIGIAGVLLVSAELLDQFSRALLRDAEFARHSLTPPFLRVSPPSVQLIWRCALHAFRWVACSHAD